MKAYPINNCYDCPARQTEPVYENDDKIGVVPVCLYDWYEDRGPKIYIEALGLASFPEWCPLIDYREEDVNDGRN